MSDKAIAPTDEDPLTPQGKKTWTTREKPVAPQVKMKGESLTSEKAIQYILNERQQMDIMYAHLRKENEALKDKLVVAMDKSVSSKSFEVEHKGFDKIEDIERLSAEIDKLKEENKKLKSGNPVNMRSPESVETRFASSANPNSANYTSSRVQLKTSLVPTRSTSAPTSVSNDLYNPSSSGMRSSRKVITMSGVLWDGVCFFKIPFNGKGLPESRLVFVKKSTKADGVNSRPVIVRDSSTGAVNGNQMYITYPLTLSWMKPNDKIENAREMILQAGTSILNGHNTPAFQKFKKYQDGKEMPHPSVCFSIAVPLGKRTLDLAANSPDAAENWKNALKQLLSSIYDEYRPNSSGEVLSPGFINVEMPNTDIVERQQPRVRTMSRISRDARRVALFRSIRENDIGSFNKILLSIANHEAEGLTINELEENGADTPLMLACRLGRVEIVKRCLFCNGKNDPHPEFGETALHAAVGANQIECAMTLLDVAAESESDALIVNLLEQTKKQTPLHYACTRGNAEMIELLVRHGANVFSVDAQGLTPLHISGKVGKRHCLAILLDQGADSIIDQGDIYGNTVLHYACESGHLNCAKLLLESAADVNILNKAKFSPYDIATSSGYYQIASLLSEYGGNSSNSLKKVKKNAYSNDYDAGNGETVITLKPIISPTSSVRASVGNTPGFFSPDELPRPYSYSPAVTLSRRSSADGIGDTSPTLNFATPVMGTPALVRPYSIVTDTSQRRFNAPLSAREGATNKAISPSKSGVRGEPGSPATARERPTPSLFDGMIVNGAILKPQPTYGYEEATYETNYHVDQSEEQTSYSDELQEPAVVSNEASYDPIEVFEYDGKLWHVYSTEDEHIYYLETESSHSQWYDPRKYGFYDENDQQVYANESFDPYDGVVRKEMVFTKSPPRASPILTPYKLESGAQINEVEEFSEADCFNENEMAEELNQPVKVRTKAAKRYSRESKSQFVEPKQVDDSDASSVDSDFIAETALRALRERTVEGKFKSVNESESKPPSKTQLEDFDDDEKSKVDMGDWDAEMDQKKAENKQPKVAVKPLFALDRKSQESSSKPKSTVSLVRRDEDEKIVLGRVKTPPPAPKSPVFVPVAGEYGTGGNVFKTPEKMEQLKREKLEMYTKMLRDGESLRVVRNKMEEAGESRELVLEILAISDTITPVKLDTAVEPALKSNSTIVDAKPSASSESKDSSITADLKDDPVLGKYAKMAAVGIPLGSVQQKMSADGISSVDVNRFLVGMGLKPITQSSSDIDKPLSIEAIASHGVYGKYVRMFNMGVPGGSIRHKMKTDGMMSDEEISKVMVALGVEEVAVRQGGDNDAASGVRRSSVQLQKIHWSPLDKEKVSKSIWNSHGGEVAAASLDNLLSSSIEGVDAEEIEKLFRASAAAAPVASKKSLVLVSNEMAETLKLHAIEGKRAQNINIGLVQYKNLVLLPSGDLDYNVLFKSICTLDKMQGRITNDNLENLSALLPTSSEVKVLIKVENITKHPAEKFLLLAMQYKQLSKRLEVFRVCETFSTCCHDASERAKMIITACNEILSNEKLAKFLQRMLAVGNFMNQGGGGRGVATGITLDSLLKMMQTKGVDKKTTILDYVVKNLLDKNEQKVLDVSEELLLLDNVSKMSGVEVVKEMDSLEKQVDFLMREKESVLRGDANNGSNLSPTEDSLYSDRLLANINNFVGKLDGIRKFKTIMQKKIKECIEYFGEDYNECGGDTLKIFSTLQLLRRALSASKTLQMEQRGRSERRNSANLRSRSESV